MKAHLDDLTLAVIRTAPAIAAALDKMSGRAAALGQTKLVPSNPNATVRELRTWMLEQREAALRANTPMARTLVAAIDAFRFF